MESSEVSRNAVIAFPGFVIMLCLILYRVVAHPLRKIPGPLLAKVSDAYEWYFDLAKSPGGQYVYKIDELHDIHGPVVRIGPNEVHIRDSGFFEVLYAFDTRHDKPASHALIFGTPLSVFGACTYENHHARRSAMNPFFSRASVRRHDSRIREQVEKLCSSISTLGKRDEVIVVRDAMVAVTVDIVTDYAFLKPAGALDSLDFSPAWERIMTGGSEAVPLARCFPAIVPILRFVPLWAIQKFNSSMAAWFDFSNTVRQQVSATMHEENSKPSQQGSKESKTLIQELLAKPLPTIEKSEDRLTWECAAVVGAATETTAVVLTSTIFHIVSNPDLSCRLKLELKNASKMNGGTAFKSWQELEKLPLLNAVVREGLRLTSAVSSRLPRLIRKDLWYDGYLIPVGSVVSMSPRDALLNPDIFPKPNDFIPERWLAPESAEIMKLMNRAFLPFNTGPRMCPGYHLALSYIYHTLAALFERFEFSLIDTERNRDIDMVRDFFVAKPTREGRGLRVNVSGES